KSGLRILRTGRRACSRGASSSASPWRAPGRCIPRSCSSTSLPPASIPGPGAAPRRRGAVHPPGAPGRALAGGAILQATGLGRSRSLHQRGVTVGLIRVLLAIALCFPFLSAGAQQRFITVATTTSTEQSGLFRHLLPEFEKRTGIQVRVVALGTGQALDLGRRGDADVAFVHDKEAEEKMVAEGAFVDRREVMYNDFVVVGPKPDPAKAKGRDVVAGLKKIA